MRLLTKSRFKLAQECPTKLFYTNKKDIYADNRASDTFLESLAEGGYQVGELAKLYYPGGHDITTLDREKALKETEALLDNDTVVIYEAAIQYDNLFIRVDILEKKGNTLRLIEVKAKSCDGNKASQFYTKRGYMDSRWASYLEDVAFQKHVIQQAYPEYNCTGYLMLADKTACSLTSGLNQTFRIVTDSAGRKKVNVTTPLSEEEISKPLLCRINVDDIIQQIFDSSAYRVPPRLSFKETIKYYSEAYIKNEKIKPRLSKACNSCEFKLKPNDRKKGLKCGFTECWQEVSGLSQSQLEKPTICSLWYPKTEKHSSDGVFLLEQLKEDDIDLKESKGNVLSRSERQWLQIERVKNPELGVYFDSAGIRQEMSQHKYPLHFIDFETSAAAIPFMAGMSPYEQIAFQYSHHILNQDGSIEHKSEFIETSPGRFPNFDFVRHLKGSLNDDNGTIFRFHNHENTILCAIKVQLEQASNPPKDRDGLIQFIKSITHSTGDSNEKWEGERDMVDLQKLVVDYYYDPATSGSNSLKAVLPAILNGSKFLKEKYSRPIYGTVTLPSLNFKEHRWIDTNKQFVSNPYNSLPPLFANHIYSNNDRAFKNHQIKDGGEALIAYSILQYVDLDSDEQEAINKSLLRYCELDTMAMVMLYEAWLDWIS